VKYLILAAALLASACSTVPTISSNPVSTAAQKIAPAGGLVATGLQNAASNLDKATAIGAIPASDPADGCVHQGLQLLGLEAVPGSPAPQSFTPVVSDVISGGSVLYILAVQAQNAPHISLSTQCKALLWDIEVQGLMSGAITTPLIVAH
jgi:hypothetical protein